MLFSVVYCCTYVCEWVIKTNYYQKIYVLLTYCLHLLLYVNINCSNR